METTCPLASDPWRLLEGVSTGSMLFGSMWGAGHPHSHHNDDVLLRLWMVYVVHWYVSAYYHWYRTQVALYRDYLCIHLLSTERLYALSPRHGMMMHIVLGTILGLQPERCMSCPWYRILVIAVMVLLSLSAISNVHTRALVVFLWGCTFQCWKSSHSAETSCTWRSVYTVMYHMFLGSISFMEARHSVVISKQSSPLSSLLPLLWHVTMVCWVLSQHG